MRDEEIIATFRREGLIDALSSVTRVLNAESSHGKYGTRGWMDREPTIDSEKVVSHIRKPWHDDDSGELHPAHAAARALMVTAQRLRMLSEGIAGSAEEEPVVPRLVIQEFAGLMELKLRRDDEKKPPWRTQPLSAHRDRIDDELRELDEAALDYQAIDSTEERRIAAIYEAIDVALEVLIFADSLTVICSHDGRGRAVKLTKSEEG